MGKLAKNMAYGLIAFPLITGGLAGAAVSAAWAQESGAVLTQGAVGESIHELEEEVRQLTGKVEELNFMVLQMQAQMDELRTQQRAAPERAERGAAPTSAVSKLPSADAAAVSSQGADAGRQPAAPGQARFDQNGNIIEKTDSVPEGGNMIADVPQTDDPDALYKIGYEHLLAGDYRAAEAVFRAFQQRFPENARLPDATFWLGEALYGQGRYQDAVEVYLAVQKDYNGAGHGPENLLKLGMSMARIGQKEVACKTLDGVPRIYKDAGSALLTRVDEERRRIKCP